MDNIHTFDKVIYQRANEIQTKNYYELFQYYLYELFNVICVLLFSIKYLLKKFVIRLIHPWSEKKNIKKHLAVVTGGGNGLGREISLRLADAGCNIAILDVDLNGAKQTAKDLVVSYGVEAKAYKVDVSDYSAVLEISKVIETEMGAVDLLINNAGLLPSISLREGSPKDIEKIMNVNLMSHFWTVRVFIEGMLARRKGHIVGISSYSGFEALGNAISYSTSKYAVKGFMDALYEELRLNEKSKDIITTTIFPSYFNSRKEFIDRLLSSVKKNRLSLLTVEQVADAVIDGILYNRRYVGIPGGYMYLIPFLSMLPFEIQDYSKDLFKPQILKSMYDGCNNELT